MGRDQPRTQDGGKPQTIENEWVEFPGGELEGKRPKALCAACRERLAKAAAGHAPLRRPRTLCFQCYRAELDRERALRNAGQLDTASEARFQFALPFEPLNRPRLAMLRADRVADRVANQAGVGRFVNERRHAQIAARHVLQSIAAEVRARQAAASLRERAMFEALHAAELQLPESWLPFVVSR